MKYNCNIESYNAEDRRLFIVYTPEDTNLAPYGNYVYIDDGDDIESINKKIEDAVPLFRWNVKSNTNAKSLVGQIITVEPQLVQNTVVEQVQDNVITSNNIRKKRDYYLALSDFTQLADVNLTEQEKAAWQVYRQALRDVTTQSGFPENIEWPVKP